MNHEMKSLELIKKCKELKKNIVEIVSNLD